MVPVYKKWLVPGAWWTGWSRGIALIPFAQGSVTLTVSDFLHECSEVAELIQGFHRTHHSLSAQHGNIPAIEMGRESKPSSTPAAWSKYNLTSFWEWRAHSKSFFFFFFKIRQG
jgi:hypothetical protein